MNLSEMVLNVQGDNELGAQVEINLRRSKWDLNSNDFTLKLSCSVILPVRFEILNVTGIKQLSVLHLSLSMDGG